MARKDSKADAKPAEQLGLEDRYSPGAKVAEMSKPLKRALGNAVASLTNYVAAGACGCTPPELSDALSGRRRFPTEWAIAIADMAGGELGEAIVTAILAPLGLRAVSTAPVEPDGPFIHRLELGYLEFGELGRTALARHRKAAGRSPLGWTLPPGREDD